MGGGTHKELGREKGKKKRQRERNRQRKGPSAHLPSAWPSPFLSVTRAPSPRHFQPAGVPPPPPPPPARSRRRGVRRGRRGGAEPRGGKTLLFEGGWAQRELPRPAACWGM